MNVIPQELDWVGKRASCSVEQVFTDLLAGVEQDVAAANKVFSAPSEHPIFGVFKGLLETQFVVKRRGRIKNVRFSRTDTQIVIVCEVSEKNWEYTIGLNDEGRCKLRRGEIEFEEWQVRKLALEMMFFSQ
jgi:hypothetical protein